MSQDFLFNAEATDFEIKNAYALAKISQLVYTPFEVNEAIRKEVISQLKAWGFSAIYFFDYTGFLDDSQAMILADAEKIIVAFRGTEPAKLDDWARDLQVVQVKKLNGRVHRGFFGTFNNLWTSKLRIWQEDQEFEQKPGIKNIIEQLLTEKKRPIWVTGHSLGGAMATIGAAACALELKDSFQPVVSLYTYGQPRVGDEDFKNNLLENTNSRVFRIVNNNDMVARIPVDFIKKIDLVDYTHAGKLIYLDTKEKVHVEELNWWQQKQDEFMGRLEDVGKPGSDGVKDHDLSRYIAILEKALLNPNNII